MRISGTRCSLTPPCERSGASSPDRSWRAAEVPNTVERSVEAGAEGFVSKTDAPEDIIRRIVGICEGTPQFNPASQRQLINDLSMQRPQSRRDEARALLDTLPSREREAVLLAAEGCTNAEIAGRMFISERTAKAHLSSAADKLDMGRVQMARLVERADL